MGILARLGHHESRALGIYHVARVYASCDLNMHN